jgi:large repetitive protein
MREIVFLALAAGCNGGVKTVPGEPSTEGSEYNDLDGDGYTDGEDCDDGNAAVSPASAELCDGIDNDCNGEIDEDVTDVFYLDGDGDGYGDENETVDACDAPEGYVPSASDCDDGNPEAHPGANEICDGADNDCNGTVDDGFGGIFYEDEDGDGYGTGEGTEACGIAEGQSEEGGDCDDTNSSVYPESEEICDGIDQDCDGEIDDGVMNIYFRDMDGDGYGDEDNSAMACELIGGYTEEGGDCDDTPPTGPENTGGAFINPGMEDLCDGVDNNCDGNLDEEAPANAPWYYEDTDEDGYGDADTAIQACQEPEGYVQNSTDCDDSDPAILPGAVEVCDLVDNDCSGAVDDLAIDGLPYYSDMDGDGYGDPDSWEVSCWPLTTHVENGDDCDDSDSEISPDGQETCDGADNDCDGDIDDEDSSLDALLVWYYDEDGDGHGVSPPTAEACSPPEGYAETDDDCDDFDAANYPGNEEVCDGSDNNCDTSVDEGLDESWFPDGDGDGHGDGGSTPIVGCMVLEGYADNGDDCDDGESEAYPGNTETCDGIDNDCSGDVDDGMDQTWYLDSDQDGYGDFNSSVVACEAPELYTASAQDCNDENEEINPSAEEICDSLDNDCDGGIDEGLYLDYHIDFDEDGFGTQGATTLLCEDTPGYALSDNDCNDQDGSIWPGAPELCDGEDNDCDSDTDEDIDQDWFYDDDGDGYGDDDISSSDCEAPSENYASVGGDCDDSDSDFNPGAPDGCDGGDYNCDGITDGDADGDGFPDYACGGNDCDDSDSGTFPEQDGSCALGSSCLEILERGYSAGTGLYTVDTNGYGNAPSPEEVYCQMSWEGGGWTLIAANDPADSQWNDDTVTNSVIFGSADSLPIAGGGGGDYKGDIWISLAFSDLLFSDGVIYAEYEGASDGSVSWHDFQNTVPLGNCGTDSGQSFELTNGLLLGGSLCNTDLFIHPTNLNGDSASCSAAFGAAGHAFGPAWSTDNGDGCPLDEPASSSFQNYGTNLPWSPLDPLYFFIR